MRFTSYKQRNSEALYFLYYFRFRWHVRFGYKFLFSPVEWDFTRASCPLQRWMPKGTYAKNSYRLYCISKCMLYSACFHLGLRPESLLRSASTILFLTFFIYFAKRIILFFFFIYFFLFFSSFLLFYILSFFSHFFSFLLH